MADDGDTVIDDGGEPGLVARGEPASVPRDAPDYVFHFNNTNVITVDITAAAIGPTVVPVLYRRDGKHVSMEGTAFCIGSSPDSHEALYVTARHVVECLIPARREIEPFLLIPGAELQVDGATPKYLHAVPITRVMTAETHCDVALVVADRSGSPTEGMAPKPMRISCTEPAVGQQTMALGYPQKPDDRQYILQGSRGYIEQVHPDKQDCSLSTFPSFRTNGLYLPSMSGGPIATFDGRIVGVVSSGMETDNADEPIGYGACIASILELTVDLLDINGVRRSFPVPNLIAEGYIKRDDSDVEMTRTDDGVVLRWL